MWRRGASRARAGGIDILNGEEWTGPPAHDGAHIGYARGAHSQRIVTECTGYFGV